MIIEKLKELGLNLITGDMIGADYCHDEYPGPDYAPEAVVEALCTEDVSKALAACAEAGVPVTVRGAGTGQVGGSVPVQGGIVLSTRAMNKILSLEDGVLRLQPGVLLQDVKAEAERNGFCYPPDPGELTATIGGNVATNAAGPCAVKYGRTGDYVTALTAVLADGSVENFTDRETIEALVGSEGTLAVITEIALRLVRAPGEDTILLLPFAELSSALSAAQAILSGGFEPAVLELLDTDLVEFSGNVTGNPVFPVRMDGERVAATLMVTLEGEDEDALMEKLEELAGLTEEGEIECLDILVGDTLPMKRDFRAAHAAFHSSMESGARSSREINISLPCEALGEMIDYVKALGTEKGIQVLLHAHAGSGGMHIHTASGLSREDFTPIFEVFAAAIYEKCTALGGDIAGEYGAGYAKSAFLSDEARAAHSALKAKYDPKGLLNPGKLA